MAKMSLALFFYVCVSSSLSSPSSESSSGLSMHSSWNTEWSSLQFWKPARRAILSSISFEGCSRCLNISHALCRFNFLCFISLSYWYSGKSGCKGKHFSHNTNKIWVFFINFAHGEAKTYPIKARKGALWALSGTGKDAVIMVTTVG